MSLLEEFDGALRSRLGLRVRRQEEDPDAILFFVDLTPLRLNFHPFTPFIFLHPYSTPTERDELAGVIRDVRLRHRLAERPCFVFMDKDSPAPSIKPDLLSQIVFLDRAAAWVIIKAPSMSDALVAAACKQLPRTLLSPYETSRPVTGSQFFGRETEIRRIVSRSKTSYVLLGMRRVGKTSLMKEAIRRIEDENLYEGGGAKHRSHVAHVIFIDCSTHTGDELLSTIVERIDIRKSRRFQPARYQDLLREASNGGRRRIHIFLDEVDKVLDLDKAAKWNLSQKLRASANEGSARYVFTGHQRFIEQLIDTRGPIFNFVEPIEVGSFRRETALLLLREPMQRMRVRIDQETTDRMIRESGGHPNILQFYCDFFIQRLDRNRRDEILAEDVEALQNDASFGAFVMSTFEINTTPLEKLIVFQMLDRERFTLPDANNALMKKRFYVRDRAFIAALTSLRHAGFLEQTGQAYAFKIPILSRLLSQRYDLKYLADHVRLEQADALVKR